MCSRPVGISHELTGWNDELLALQEQFSEELSIEYTTDKYLDVAKELLKEKIIDEEYKTKNPSQRWGSGYYYDSGRSEYFEMIERKNEKFVPRDVIAFDEGEFNDKWSKYDKKINHEKLVLQSYAPVWHDS